jgi:diaminohydroxyphosphoribosylaminopyrimidine deaminase/5-amino-6-(5-phosphoribosylamino)uracil reductase
MERRDERHMREALELAQRGWGRVSPRPLVGALVVQDDAVVGRGWYAGPRGSPHAEVRAILDSGDDALGSTVVCTLEPCAHQGSTPPCTETLIRAGVRRVVVGVRDPNPIVNGRGVRQLREAGIEVVVGVLADSAHRLNEAFDKHITCGLPFVTLKLASSLDGKAAASDGTSKWITGEQARADVQRLRAGADAVIVGAGTAVADDPVLTVRDRRFADARPPLRVVVDSGGRVPATGKLFDPTAPTLVATTDRAGRDTVLGWRDAGAEVLVLDTDVQGCVSLVHLAAELGKREVQSILVEGGPTIAWSFVRDGMVDKVVLFLAPRLVGGVGAPSAVMGGGFAPIASARRLELSSIERVGDDLRVEAYVHGDH